MGLDMYLTREIYVKNWGHDKNFQVSVTYKGEPITIDTNSISSVTEEVGYWRKANAIHQWFVGNVQDGKDDCKEYYVSEDDIKQLMEDCQNVLNNPEAAEHILPTSSGFFFGSINYDEYYKQDLIDTIKICEKALRLFEKKSDVSSTFYYRASW